MSNSQVIWGSLKKKFPSSNNSPSYPIAMVPYAKQF